MSPIEQQQEIISELCRVIHGAAPEGSAEAGARFVYSRSPDGSSSLRRSFWYFMGEERVSDVLDFPEDARPLDTIRELHALMKAHTGGEWDAFTITLDQDGKASVKFEYPDAEG